MTIKELNAGRVILGSGSPRRKELLSQIGIKYEIHVSNVKENYVNVVPKEIVKELSYIKAMAVFEEVNIDNGLNVIITADTLVAVDGKILGKPRDKADAVRMLKSIQGRSHEVYTGVTIVKAAPVDDSKAQKGRIKIKTFVDKTRVTFYPMTDAEIEAYVATNEPFDKAGAYAIQGYCAKHIKGISGEYNTVVGLPVGKLYQELMKM